MASGEGYFAHPLYGYIPVKTHIDYIISNPDKFGMTLEEIQAIYNKHKERLHSEGNAREEIIKKVSEDGWIRIRHYIVRGDDKWSIQFDKWNLRKKNVMAFLEWAVLDKEIISPSAEVALLGYLDNHYEIYTYVNGGIIKIFEDRAAKYLNASFKRVIEYLDYDLTGTYISKKVMAGGFSRLVQIMSGLVPSVKTFGIMTWENPMGEKESAEFNNKKQKELNDLLRRGGHSFVQIKGKFGSYENPYFMHNIDKESMKEYGKRGNQEAVIFGEVLGSLYPNEKSEEIPEVKPTVRFVYMDLKRGEELIRNVWLPISKEETDMYSQYKGRKFVIPFFDDTYDIKDIKKADYKAPEIEVMSSHNVFYIDDFDIEEFDTIEERFSSYNYSKNTTHNYHTRGMTYAMLKNLKKSKEIEEV